MSFMTEMESARHVALRLSGALEEIEAKVTKHTQEKVDRLGAALEERVSEMLNARIENIADRVSKAVLSHDGHQEPGHATALPAKPVEAALVQTVANLEQSVRKLQAEAGAARLQELEKKVTRDIKDLQQQLTQLAKDWDAEATQLVTQLERRISRQLSGDTDSEEKEERVPPHKEFLEGKEKPTSYRDALEQVGGEKKLEEFRELSGTSLMESYKVAPEMAEVLSGDSKARLAYSVKLNYQKYVNNLDELIERCKKYQKVFFDKVKEIATKTGGKNCKPPLKSKERCEAKATFKYRDASGDVSWHRLTDIVRDTVVYGNLDDMYEGLKLMHQDGDLEIVEFNDRYFHPLDGGYRDLQLTVRISDIVCELQLNVAGMIYIKEGSGHRTFEVARELAAAVADTGTEAVKRAGNILKWGKDHLGKDATRQLQDILSSSEKPLLLKAAQTGNSQLMSIFLEHRANVNVQDKISGQTALHKAMEGGYERAMWLLLEHRAEVDTADTNGIVPLMQGFLQLRSQPDSEFIGRTVCILSQVAGMVRLKAAQDNLKKVVHDKLKPNSQLLQHCQDGDEVSVLELLKNYADANSPNDKKERPLHKALSPIGGCQNLTERHLQICRLLVQFNADGNSRDEEGRTPLVLAVRLGSCEAVQILLQQNATAQTLQVEDRQSWQHEDVQYLLRPTDDSEIAQVQAAALKQLHVAGCDFTTPTARDELPTFFAARCNNTAALEVLLEAKCDPDRPNANRDLAITVAARDGQTEAVRWLLEHCSVERKDAQRALHAARAQPENEELISLLERKWTRLEMPFLTSNLDKFGGRGGDEKDADKIGFQRPLTAKLKEKEGRSTGRRYYELELLTTFDWIQAGWASGSFQGDKDLGKHREAWCWEGMLGGFMEKIRAGKAEQ
ncbi:Ankrd17, partial [Symbiodinium necroappetens]